MATRSRPSPSLREGDPVPPEDHCPAAADSGVAGLYQAYGSSLTRLLRRHIGSDHAPDLLHQIFARFLALAPETRAAIQCPEAYLKRSARNALHDAHKASHRQAADRHLSDADVCLTAPCQIAALEARDMLNRIEQATRKLKPLTREIFLAHRLDGYSYAEIALRTGLSVKAVEKHMSRAIAHIDRTLSIR